jgi:hypothetical protein
MARATGLFRLGSQRDKIWSGRDGHAGVRGGRERGSGDCLLVAVHDHHERTVEARPESLAEQVVASHYSTRRLLDIDCVDRVYLALSVVRIGDRFLVRRFCSGSMDQHVRFFQYETRGENR